jgi:hypothetical protein
LGFVDESAPGCYKRRNVKRAGITSCMTAGRTAAPGSARYFYFWRFS